MIPPAVATQIAVKTIETSNGETVFLVQSVALSSFSTIHLSGGLTIQYSIA